MGYDLLPDSVLIGIANFLDGLSFAAFTAVCKKYRALFKDQSIWKQILGSSYKFKDSVYLETSTAEPGQYTHPDSTEPKFEVNWRKIYVDTRNHDRMKWKLNQVFGEDPSSVNEENVITTVEFDSTGEFLSIGYQAGQVVVFRNTTSDTYKFFTQFESHHPEFDFLTSLEIEEKINKIRWVRTKYSNNARLILTTNDKTIKLFKMSEKKPKKYSNFSSIGARLSQEENTHHNFTPISPSNSSIPEVVQRKVFQNAHAYNINSITMCSDGQTFLSSDDLRINMWDIEKNKECFTIVDTKPPNMNELNEVLTCTEFHPREPSNFVFSSSKGFVYMGDMRQQALCDKTLKTFREKEGAVSKSFFSEVTSSISDVRYSSSGRYIIARDYLHIKIWDVNMDSEPIKVYNVHDHLRGKLYELYENDFIFDKFELCRSQNDMHFLTGSYSNNFMIFDIATAQVKYMQATNHGAGL
eukprot:TRINITY_DN1730_c0_g1_i2.p1 TRINITY_DN1730_c0_g1~~TRINITY_DN1730_c0_g1_i2.p1  ORF type:complete len:468 (+),score=132.32 TRINITY_DN1730_c0_g1_i2:177-1580(+)